MKKRNSKRLALSNTKAVISVIAVLLVSLPASAETFTGKLIGYGCVRAGTTCPVDKLDPHLKLEPDFVLQTDTDQYYFMPDIGRDIKVRHVLETVQVEGDRDKRYNVITVKEFSVEQGGAYKMIWSRDLNEEVERLFDQYTRPNS